MKTEDEIAKYLNRLQAAHEALDALLNECYHCDGDGYHSCGMETTEAYEKAAALINFTPAPDVLEGP